MEAAEIIDAEMEVAEIVETETEIAGVEVEEESSFWNKRIVMDFKIYLQCGEYPGDLLKEKRRNFRKRAKDFVVKDGELYYKKSGDLRLALSTSDEWLRAFQVGYCSYVAV